MQSLLVDLDALLDTRIATISQVDPELAERVFTESELGDDYYGRFADDFTQLDPDFDQAKYDELYRRRGVDILPYSRMTGIAITVHEVTSAWQVTQDTMGLDTGFEVVVNTYPYAIDSSVLEAIELAVYNYTASKGTVRSVCLPPEELSPSVLGNDYSAYVVYDFDIWCTEHLEDLSKNKIPEFTFIAPALYPEEEPSEKDLPKDDGKTINPFEAMRLIISEFVGLNYLEAKYYSIYRA